MSRILKCPSGHERKIPDDWDRDTASCNYCDHVFRLHRPEPPKPRPAPLTITRKPSAVAAKATSAAAVAAVTVEHRPKIVPLRCPFCSAVEMPEVRTGFSLGAALVAFVFTAPAVGLIVAFPILIFFGGGSLLGAMIFGCVIPGLPAAFLMSGLIGYSAAESCYHCRSCGSRIAVAA